MYDASNSADISIQATDPGLLIYRARLADVLHEHAPALHDVEHLHRIQKGNTSTVHCLYVYLTPAKT